MKSAVPILMYHQIAPEAPAAFRKYNVTPGDFRRQMGWLRRSGYNAVSMDDLAAARQGSSELPPRAIVITFDDGFEACIQHAVPILQEFGFTAIFYLVAGLIGRESAWLQAERGCSFPLADWTSVRELMAAGFQCGAHTMSHPRLTQLPSNECLAELRKGKRLLEDSLGTAIRHFAYPFGDYDARVRGLAREAGFETACSVQIGLSEPNDDLMALHRVPINGSEGLLDFTSRVRTAHSIGERFWDKARALRRRLTPAR